MPNPKIHPPFRRARCDGVQLHEGVTKKPAAASEDIQLSQGQDCPEI
jgi:hypothetical protein